MAIHIGCGSWTDDAYAGLLYAKGWPKAERLAAYAQWFDRIEINSFTHAIPPLRNVAKWVEQTPAGFIFDVKLPPQFSENPSAAAQGEMHGVLLRAVQPIVAAKKLGTFLLTLPPSFSPDIRRLDEITALVEKLRPHLLAVELRNRAWVETERRAATLDYFAAQQIAWVAVDMFQAAEARRLMPAVDVVTDPRLAYMRLHGRNPAYARVGSTKEGHHHDYTDVELKEIAGRVKALAELAKNVHVTFNNHAEDFAPKAAIALKRLLGQPVLGAPPEKGGTQLELM
ncbi:MAG: hypothetical protein JWQ62_2443 [Lacunisphaera sp.]|nr:hypothetical protein [Lacunisphaera sp.]